MQVHSDWCEYKNMCGSSNNCMLTSTCGLCVCKNLMTCTYRTRSNLWNPIIYMTTLQLLHVHMCGQLDLLVCCSNLPCTDTASAILCTVLAILGLSTTLSSNLLTRLYHTLQWFYLILVKKRRHQDLAMIQTLIVWTLVRCSYRDFRPSKVVFLFLVLQVT